MRRPGFGKVRALLAKAGAFTHNPPNHCLGDFMASFGFRNVRRGLMLAAALSVAALSKPALAYTPEQQQACTGDAMALCGAFIPDVDRITVCMIQNKARLSPGCRAHFRPEPEPAAAARAAGRPVSIAPAQKKPVSAKAKKPKKPAKPAGT